MSAKFVNSFSYKLIYIFRINDTTHKGLLKIGDATLKCNDSVDKLPPNCKKLNQAAKERINSYTNTAGIAYELLHTELAIRTDIKNGTITAFRDHDVHAVLENSGIKKKNLDGTNAREWYKIDLDTAIRAVEAVKQFRPTLNPSEKGIGFTPVILRPEQLEAVNMTLKEFKTGNRMLWNAKMRFGKTFSALELIHKMGFGKTIIVTHRPVVDSGWYDDFGKIFYYEEDYIYGSKNNGNTIEYLLSSEKKFIYFASIQDLRGSEKVGGKYGKNAAVFNTKWDCVIVDEAHEGTTTALGEEVIKSIVAEDTKFLALSGTPFNILGNYDTNVYTWDYIMEQQRKAEWDKEHFGDSNPYDELPKMNIFVYDLGKLYDGKYVELEDKAFNFREFFRTWTGDIKRDFKDMPEGAEVGDFVNEDDVLSFLNLISKEDKESQYPYSTAEFRDIFRHSLWMVPGVSAARALAKMMRNHPVFSFIKVINVAGEGDEEEKSESALEKVRTAIKEAGEDGYTITLSCGRLTTGVTIKEWNTVLMLAGSFSTSASSYLQTIFRVQSPCNKNGKIKDNCYVFDFAPDRTLKMVAESVTLSTKAGKATETDKAIMGEFLNYCPVISIEGTMMKEYSTNKLLQQLKRAYADKAVQNGFDDTNLYNDELLKLSDVDLEEFNKLKGIIGSSKAQKKTRDIPITQGGFTNEEYQMLDKLEKKPKKERTPEEQKKLEELKEKKKNRNSAISILRAVSIRMPLLIYGADIPIDEEFTLDKFLDDKIVDEASWIEFMPKDVTREIFKKFMKYYDQDIFIAAGRKIRNTVRGADELPITERVKQIASLFACFKNPDKETVLTPWRVVNMHLSDCLGGYSFYEENPPVNAAMLEEPRFVNRGKITDDTFNNCQAHILEINSKTGLYPLYVVYSIFRARCAEFSDNELTLDKQNELWKKTVCENIYVICKTPMAKYITRRTLAGYKDIPVNAHYFDDLINTMKNKQRQFVDRVLKPSYWHKEGDKMKFDAVVGNPPYQEETGSTSRQATPIYNLFVEQAKKTNPKYLSMIMPSRWFAGGMGLDKFRETMMNDKRISFIKDFVNAKDCFPQSSISGGVCYFLRDAEYKGLCTFTNVLNNNLSIDERSLSEFFCLIRYNEAVNIVRLIAENTNEYLSDIVSSISPFGISTKIRGKSTKSILHNITLHSSAGISYISASDLPKGDTLLKGYKVLLSQTSAEHAGEPSKDGNYRILTSSMKVINPNEVCTHSYLILGNYEYRESAENLLSYLKTRFVRFLILLTLSSIHISKTTFSFVPSQNFTEKSDIDWSKSIPEIDQQLYEKYGLTQEEIDFIESMIKPMD